MKKKPSKKVELASQRPEFKLAQQIVTEWYEDVLNPKAQESLTSLELSFLVLRICSILIEGKEPK